MRKGDRDPSDGREQGHGRDEVLESGERRGIHGGVTKAGESEGDCGVDPRGSKSVDFSEDLGSVTVLQCKPVRQRIQSSTHGSHAVQSPRVDVDVRVGSGQDEQEHTRVDAGHQ